MLIFYIIDEIGLIIMTGKTYKREIYSFGDNDHKRL